MLSFRIKWHYVQDDRAADDLRLRQPAQDQDGGGGGGLRVAAGGGLQHLPPQHRQPDGDGPGATQPPQGRLLEHHARLLELGQVQVQSSVV